MQDGIDLQFLQWKAFQVLFDTIYLARLETLAAQWLFRMNLHTKRPNTSLRLCDNKDIAGI